MKEEKHVHSGTSEKDLREEIPPITDSKKEEKPLVPGPAKAVDPEQEASADEKK